MLRQPTTHLLRRLHPPPPPLPLLFPPRLKYLHRRQIWSLSAIHPVVLAPLVFAGLTVTLWSYKCMMMILFQSRIIYMPGIPLGARREMISDYASLFHGVVWKKGSITTDDGNTLATATASNGAKGKELLVVYFQGNASSTPPRLPQLSSILSSLSDSHARITILVPSYRGYWTSTGRPSQSCIERDLVAIFSHISRCYPEAETVFWGQSIGCGILMTGFSQNPLPNVVGMVLETPFVSVREMLVALYPQKWLPYRYLGVFLWNRWELVREMDRILMRGWRGKMLVLEAGADELVPEGQAREIANVARTMGVEVDQVTVAGALHVECLSRPKGRKAVVGYLKEMAGNKEQAGKWP
ncbi:alpha/beta-hydrolase [Wilcoxina mikolae CBS 423.85]|nr:alpha/beta-hydrolase [Wilcoxina mikolae CBS 423.85]